MKTVDLVALAPVLKPGAKHNGVAGDVVDTLKMILREAVRDGILTTVPHVATPARRSVRHDETHTLGDDAATPAQVEALYEAVPEPWRIAVLFAEMVPAAPRGGAGPSAARHRLERRADDGHAVRPPQKNGTTGELSDPKSD